MNYFNLQFFVGLVSTLLINKANSLEADKIIAGDLPVEEMVRFQVSVQVEQRHRCGGGIISPKLVLTAALCIINEGNGQLVSIHLSVLATSNVAHPEHDSVRIDVFKVYTHTSYLPIINSLEGLHSTAADIAILELTHDFDMNGSRRLSILKIPMNFTQNRKTFVIAGYGYNSYSVRLDLESGMSRRHLEADGKLRFAKARTITSRACELAHNTILHNSKFCARVQQSPILIPRGVCGGDSGSPLVYKSEVVYGILISGPPECDERYLPGIYTRVAYYRRSLIDFVMRGEDHNEIRIDILMRGNSSNSQTLVP